MLLVKPNYCYSIYTENREIIVKSNAFKCVVSQKKNKIADKPKKYRDHCKTKNMYNPPVQLWSLETWLAASPVSCRYT